MIYYGMLTFFGVVFRLLYRFRVIGTENVPKSGRLIVAANHTNFWDPVMVGIAMPRKIHFMSKEELFRYPVFSWVIRKMAAFPVKRGAPDRNAIRYADGLLATEQILAIFPEGTRQTGEELGDPHLGVAFFALRNGAPVVPMAITGSAHLRPFRSRVQVIIGKPIPVAGVQKASKEQLASLADTVMEQIGILRGRES